jgi:hypothetical protein
MRPVPGTRPAELRRLLDQANAAFKTDPSFDSWRRA